MAHHGHSLGYPGWFCYQFIDEAVELRSGAAPMKISGFGAVPGEMIEIVYDPRNPTRSDLYQNIAKIVSP